MAGAARRHGECAGGVSPAGVALHAELNGAGERAGESAAAGAIAGSTRPLDATRELATAAGALSYTEVSERIAVNIAHCLDTLLEQSPDDIRITSDWICGIHRSIAVDLFPDWAGRFTHHLQSGRQKSQSLFLNASSMLKTIAETCLECYPRLH